MGGSTMITNEREAGEYVMMASIEEVLTYTASMEKDWGAAIAACGANGFIEGGLVYLLGTMGEEQTRVVVNALIEAAKERQAKLPRQ